MIPRYAAIKEISSRQVQKLNVNPRSAFDAFDHLTFNRAEMQRALPKDIFAHMLEVMEGKAKLNSHFTDVIATAMKDWAIAHGATHYSHWFQPLTGLIAEKHDAFIDWKKGHSLIEKFSGNQLLRGEPDASSFPSGGLRRTAQARGYTTWDPTTPVFLWKSGSTTILCIPSLFFSWKGESLDMKSPLMRSEEKIGAATLRLLSLLGEKATHAFATLGCEQEYFLVDRALYELRPDLLLAGKTVFGAASPRGQELEDHYFRTINERVLCYIQDFEAEAYALGIPLKTRHSEVAPGQYEVAPLYEKASIAVDHNLLLMELMKKVAYRHNLVCLLHEKPFAEINGSGKHCNWSIATDTGLNLFDPSNNPGDNLRFLLLLTATLNAVYRYGDLLRASIASAGNDHRLGGNEAPPPIISVFLGEDLEKLLDAIEKGTPYESVTKNTIDLKIRVIPEFTKDNSDRNRTSPFAFTGNKFEFRAVGSSAHCAFPLTVLNAIVAQELHLLLDEVEAAVKEKATKALKGIVLPIIQKQLKNSRKICFSGNGYSSEWVAEAKNRGLPVIEKSFYAFQLLKEEKTRELFQDILSEKELAARYITMVERYSKIINIEAKLMVELFQTQILPVALQYQKEVAESIAALQKAENMQLLVASSKMMVGRYAAESGSGILETREESAATRTPVQTAFLKKFHLTLNQAMEEIDLLEARRQYALTLHEEDQGAALCDEVVPLMKEARERVDALEQMIDDRLWPLPKYRELLFLT